jgi:integrase
MADTFFIPKKTEAPTKKTGLAKLDAGTLANSDISAQLQIFLAAATSENTRRAYRSAIRHFLTWGGKLPSDEATIIRYLLAHAQTLNPRTIALRLTALSQWHVHQDFADPASRPTVRKTLVGIERMYGAPKKKAKALPVEDLELIVANLVRLDTLKAKRDNALLQLGFFGGYRRSEIVSLEVAHLSWEAEGVVITLPRSKTDQRGEGIMKAIPFGDGVCCPVTALRHWLTSANISSGALFRSVNQWREVGSTALHASSVNVILSHCASLANLAYTPELSSHSLRRGMATSAHRAGASFSDIKRQGGWRHDGTVQGYIEEAGQFEDNAVNSLLKRKIKV